MSKEKFTLKEQKFFDFYIDKDNKETFGNATQSAMKAYNCKDENTAGVIGWENLRKLKNTDIMQKSMERVGLSLPKLNEKLSKLTDSDNENVALGAIKTGYQLNGELITNKTESPGDASRSLKIEIDLSAKLDKKVTSDNSEIAIKIG